MTVLSKPMQRLPAVLLFLLALIGSASAQTGPSIDVQRVLPTLPGLPGSAAPPSQIGVPAPPPNTSQPQGNHARFLLKAVRIEGATVFDTADLATALGDMVGRVVSLAEIEAARQTMTRRYVDAGYINSGVLIPQQDASDGTVVFQVIEGRLTAVTVAPSEAGVRFGRLKAAYIERRLMGSPGQILNVNQLQDRFALLLEDPNVIRLRGNLQPGNKLGEAVLFVEAESAKPVSASVTLGNVDTVSTGPFGPTFTFDVRNMAGWGDALALKLSGGEGRRRGSARFSAPITSSDITPYIEVEYAESQVIEAPFDALDITNTFRRAAVGVDIPVFRTPNQRFGIGFSLETKESDTQLLGAPLPPVGIDDETINVTVARFTQEFTDQRTNQILALRSSFGFGLPILGASDGAGGDVPDSAFVTWLGQAQYVRRLSERLRLVARGQVQLASGPLFATEQLALGGLDTVRGYRKNAAVNDNGAFASLELPLRLDPTKVIPSLPAGLRGPIEIAPFIDAGVSWSRRSDTNRTVLAGAGAALRWQPNPNLSVGLTYAHPLRNLDRPLGESDLTDEAFYFTITLSYN